MTPTKAAWPVPGRRQKCLQPGDVQPSRLTSTLCPEIRVRYSPGEAGKVDSLKVSLANFAVMPDWRCAFAGILRGHGSNKLDSWLNDARTTGLSGIRRLAQ